MDLLVLLETGLDPLHNALSLLQVQLHVDLAVGLVLEVVQDLVILLLGHLVIDLRTAIPASLEGLHQFLILAFDLSAHLCVQASLELL